MRRVCLFAVAAMILTWSGAGELKAANLVVNGSFETPGVGTAWAIFPNGGVPGWTDTSGNDGIEIDYPPVLGGPAYAGSQSMELDGTTFDTVAQTVTGLKIGQKYTLSWAYGDRPDSGPQQTNVYFGGNLVAIDYGTGASGPLVWAFQSFTVTATSTTEDLSFAAEAVGPRPSYGNEIDAVSLTTPEPASLLLLAPCLAVLLGYRRRRRAS